MGYEIAGLTQINTHRLKIPVGMVLAKITPKTKKRGLL